MPIYNKLTSRSITKTIGRVVTLSTDGGATYGDVYLYDLAAPAETVTLAGQITGLTEWNAFYALINTPNAQGTVYDNAGNSFTGLLSGLSWDDNPEAAEIKNWRVQLTVR